MDKRPSSQMATASRVKHGQERFLKDAIQSHHNKRQRTLEIEGLFPALHNIWTHPEKTLGVNWTDNRNVFSDHAALLLLPCLEEGRPCVYLIRPEGDGGFVRDFIPPGWITDRFVCDSSHIAGLQLHCQKMSEYFMWILVLLSTSLMVKINV